MYLVKIRDRGTTFFTDLDPSIEPPAGRGRYVTCQRAEFKDSYTPSDGVKQRREADAREALQTGATRTMRIRSESVDYAIQID